MNAEQVTKTLEIIANLYDFLDKNGIKVSAAYQGETNLEGWRCDYWRVTTHSQRGVRSFAYHTGTGLRNRYKKPVPPSPADVLYCLVSDFFSVHHALGFADWAGNMGLNPDSIKDRAVFDTCCEDATKLAKVFTFTQLSELQEILQDY